ncbi:MAG: nitronate monooxygenase [Dehalococcoidia bacterium]|jgi:enoyl-[acyl-carrier protein] reductase II
MIKTPMTELFGCKYPIMLAGMNWITTPKLVAAVCNAGGLGIFATARCTLEETRKNIREIRNLTDKPFGINQILNLGPIAKETIEVAIEEKVPVINYTLGKPWFIDKVHAYGGKVLGTTATVKHALKAQEIGCDAIVITGLEAAAHGEEATTLVLLPIVASKVKIPVISAGGFQNGGGLIAALALGASGISMGTRFAMTQESPVHDNFKQYCMKATENDTLRSERFDGMPSRLLKTSVTERLVKSRFPLAEAILGAMQIKQMLNLSWGQFIGMSIKMMTAEESHPLWTQARQAAFSYRALKGIYDGDMQEGVFVAGQVVGACEDLPAVKVLVDRIMSEAEQFIKKEHSILAEMSASR